MLSGDSILQRLEQFPRIALADYPTPLEYLPRLSAQLKREVFIKRDDTFGPGLGGNKTRKLEYLLAEARQQVFIQHGAHAYGSAWMGAAQRRGKDRFGPGARFH